jgi:hypothetical protein
MATLATIASKAFAPGLTQINLNSGQLAGVTLITVTLQRAGWPAGLCAQAAVDWGTSKASGFVYGTDARWVDGPVKVVVGKPAAATSGTVTLTVSQPFTSSVLVEGA